MDSKLLLIANEQYPLQPGSIGRASSCDIRIANSSVSTLHAIIKNVESDSVLIDKGSKNGTFINGKKLQPETEYTLKQGDTVVFGKVEAKIKILPDYAKILKLNEKYKIIKEIKTEEKIKWLSAKDQEANIPIIIKTLDQSISENDVALEKLKERLK